MSALVQAAVVGATGYVGFELTKLLLRHPRLKRPVLFTRESREAGPYAAVFPHLEARSDLRLEPFSWETLEACSVEVLFLATPHELSHELAPEAVARGLRVVDLSGAWRLRQPDYHQVYQLPADTPAQATLRARACYGLPELNRACLPQAQLVANPGCYATAAILALAPLVKAGVLDPERDIVCDAKSGVSGAGKQATSATHFVEVADNFRAYNPFTHRHTGEILEQLGLRRQQFAFTPHLLPVPRGIFASVYVPLARALDAQAVSEILQDFYRQAAWVRVFRNGRLPELQFVLHTNYCDLGFVVDPTRARVLVVSCIDNLLKGAAGQAVQNLNLMYGWPETEGLA
jgi:N-acetyl-gamma-glutamyl-phosphate reductase